MALFLVSPPALQPVSVAEAKAHLRVEVDQDNALIESLIQGATEYAQNLTHRAFISQTWDDKRDAFPCGRIVLPYPPVSSITSVTYTATDGTSTTWSSALYTTSLPTGPHAAPAEIEPIYGGIYPQTRSVINAVTVRCVCGYGASGGYVPEAIRAAIKLLVAHWYDRREPVNVGNLVTQIPIAVDSLLWPFKVV
jgi:uncharacterized phiE125 gp8 family phage protein